ncbi:hypothetical protein D3C83_185830 [compost metagenome]
MMIDDQQARGQLLHFLEHVSLVGEIDDQDIAARDVGRFLAVIDRLELGVRILAMADPRGTKAVGAAATVVEN